MGDVPLLFMTILRGNLVPRVSQKKMRDPGNKAAQEGVGGSTLLYGAI